MSYESNMNSSDEGEDVKKELHEDAGLGGEGAPKKAGRRKINIEFIDDKSRRHITFSKRKAGIMKKAYELSTLTGTQVLLLVASETGHVYTFATPKLQPLITKPEGKNLIQSCLNAPEITPPSPPAHAHTPHPAATPRLTSSQAPYNEPSALYAPNEPSPYPAEHVPPHYEKDGSPSASKEHRALVRTPEKSFHIDVAQINNHLGMYAGYPQSSSSSMSGHSMGMGYPPMGPRYAPTPSAHSSSSMQASNAGTPPSGSYGGSSFPPSVAGMMAQYPSPGFGSPGSNSYVWGHGPASSSMPPSSQHLSEVVNRTNAETPSHKPQNTETSGPALLKEN